MASADAAPAGFSQPEAVYTALDYPTNLEFAPNGRVFVAEKDGVIRTATTIGQNLTQFADLQSVVHNFWDRGLLGLAVHPDFPGAPYVYVLYTYGVPLPIAGGPTQGYGDSCPTPPGATGDGCLVSARLSRLTSNAQGTAMVGAEQVLINDWCQQYPSHSIGDLQFGPDGALYVSGGDGASFNFTDWGQAGGSQPNTPTPRNPCDDPPGGVGGAMTSPSAEGGALRSQDLRTPATDPVTLDGTIIRVDPDTGAAHAGNPSFNDPNLDANGERIVAYGLRNPYRFTFRPGTNDLYIGDVGWSSFEEVNVHPNPNNAVLNFGWPCREGTANTSYNGLSLCSGLSYTAPFFDYGHNENIAPGDACPPANQTPMTPTSSSTTGLAFYTGGNYPGEYNGALFGADYSRNCIWVMYPGTGGAPNPADVEVFHYGPDPDGQGPLQPMSPVDLEMGSDGNMYFVSYLQGTVSRFRYVASNNPPVASIEATPTSGSAPLTVTFDGSSSTDPDGHPIVEYLWDLDNDGQFDDGSGEVVQWTFNQPGNHTARLRIRDFPGEFDTDSIQIQASNTAPAANITSPAIGTLWSVGQVIGFSGTGTDPEQGNLPPQSLTWRLILYHCEEDGSCHEHTVQNFNGVASGSFTAPDHEYPSHLELRLTVTDQFGVQSTATRQLNPRTVQLTFATTPTGLELDVNGETQTTPFAETFIVGNVVEMTAPSSQESQSGSQWTFSSWSDGKARSHSVIAPSTATSYTAAYSEVLGVSIESGLFFVRDDGLYRTYDPGPTGQLGQPVISGPDWPDVDGWEYSGVDVPDQANFPFVMLAYDSSGEMYVQANPVDYFLSGFDASRRVLLVDEPNWDVVAGVDLGCCGGTVLTYRNNGTFSWRPVGLANGDPILLAPVQSGTGYTTGWTSIVPIDLDGDGTDEILFYRSGDGLFRYYDIKSDGRIGKPMAAGNGYTTGWDSITAVDLDGDGQDEMMFYRSSDGLFRYYNIGPTGSLPAPIRKGKYTTGWDSITAFGP